jgi:hypothetical protein
VIESQYESESLTPNFRKMSDEDLEHFINTRPSSYDIHAAIFEHDRRARESADKATATTFGLVTVVCAQLTISSFRGEN